jgi:hypothetical protein
MVALNVEWSWVVVLVGVAAGALLALAAIVADLPMVLRVVRSALGGASAITTGIMLLTGALDTADFDTDAVVARADHDWWWYAFYVVLAVVGLVAQLRAIDRAAATMRESWAARRQA